MARSPADLALSRPATATATASTTPATATAAAAAACTPRLDESGANLLAIALALTGLGIVMVYSTTAVAADRALSDSTYFLRKQVMWALLAGITCVLASATDYRDLLRWSRALMAVLTVLLIACLVQPGSEVKGARRWLNIAGMGMQPSELGKIVLVLYLAARVHQDEVRGSLKGLARVLVWPAVVIGLVALEPDFGTSLFLGAISGAVLLTAGIPLRYLAAIGLPAVVAGSAFMLTRFDHVRSRIEVFLHPEADLSGKGYQIHQALIALGSGGVWGNGLGESRQKLYFLPDDHTDFILAVIGEELGLLGTLLVLAAFVALVVYGLRIARRAADAPGLLLAVGLTTALGLQGTINMAVVTASVPTKGISLPFVSYGGSALCVALGAVGVLLNVAAQGRRARGAAPATPTAATPARGGPRRG